MLNMSTLSTNDQDKSFWELVYGSVNQVLADHRPAVLYDVIHFRLFCKEYLTRLKNFHLLFSAVISEHFSKNRVIISVLAAKIWYLKNVRFLLGHPVQSTLWNFHQQISMIAFAYKRNVILLRSVVLVGWLVGWLVGLFVRRPMLVNTC